MPNANDSFVVVLKDAHCDWGEYRNTNSRDQIPGEAYIPIPREYARRYGIYNSNSNENTCYQVQVINGCPIQGFLLAQGSQERGDVYAKQFSVQGDLRELGRWFASVNAVPGGQVEVIFTSSTSLSLRYF